MCTEITTGKGRTIPKSKTPKKKIETNSSTYSETELEVDGNARTDAFVQAHTTKQIIIIIN